MNLLERCIVKYLVRMLRKRYLFDSEMTIRSDGFVCYKQNLANGDPYLNKYKQCYGDVS